MGSINKLLSVFDLDGVCIDSSHRYRTNEHNQIDLQYWRENCTPEKISMDKLLPHAKQFHSDVLSIETTVIIATARVMSEADFAYIDNHLSGADHIVHRLDEADQRKGINLKVNGINSCLDIHDYDYIHIYEDNESYLKGITEHFEKMGHGAVYPMFVQSNQGH